MIKFLYIFLFILHIIFLIACAADSINTHDQNQAKNPEEVKSIRKAEVQEKCYDEVLTKVQSVITDKVMKNKKKTEMERYQYTDIDYSKITDESKDDVSGDLIDIWVEECEKKALQQLE